MDLNDLNINDFHIDATLMPEPEIKPFPLTPWGKIAVSGYLDPSWHGQAVFQEYLSDGHSQVTIDAPEHPRCRCYMPEFVSRRGPRPRNTRIQRVQARRKLLDLGQDGKYCGMRTRRASLVYVQAVEEWIVGKRSMMPHRAEYGHIPARVRRKKAKQVLRWKPINLSDRDREFIAQYSYDPLINPFGVTEQDLGELNNVNRP